MASIKISELRPAGSELFSDSESYISELSEGELDIQGGFMPLLITATVVAITLYAGNAY